jgi:tripartite-type tricarboxylate transporter receptor subunit TctC
MSLAASAPMYGPYDMIYEATGFAPLVFEAMQVLGKNGVLILASVTGGMHIAQVPADMINLDFVLGNKVVVGTVNGNREYFEAAVRDLAMAQAQYPGWTERLLTHPIQGLDNYRQMLDALTNGKGAIKVFVEIAPLGGQPNVLVVAPSAGIKSVQDLVAQAKQKPGVFNYGSAGAGSGTHINAEKFRLATGIDAVHVPYKGTPEALADTMAGRITYFFSPISAALPQVKDGKLLALAVSSAKRSSALKDVPTIAESGVPGFDYNLWVGMFGPAAMPADVVDRISKDVERALAAPEIKERLANLGAEPMPMTPAQFKQFAHDEMDAGAKVVKAAGIKGQ